MKKDTFPKRHPVWTAVLTILALTIVIGAATGGGSDNKSKSNAESSSGPSTESSGTSTTSAAETQSATQASERTKPKPSKPALGSYARAKHELRDKFHGRIKELSRFEGTIILGIKADDSGVFPKTMIRQDANDAFRQVFKDADYAPKEMIIQFHGPLVNKATGKESDGIWAVYSMTRPQGKAIEWSNQDQIDWDQYLTMRRTDL